MTLWLLRTKAYATTSPATSITQPRPCCTSLASVVSFRAFSGNKMPSKVASTSASNLVTSRMSSWYNKNMPAQPPVLSVSFGPLYDDGQDGGLDRGDIER